MKRNTKKSAASPQRARAESPTSRRIRNIGATSVQEAQRLVTALGATRDDYAGAMQLLSIARSRPTRPPQVPRAAANTQRDAVVAYERKLNQARVVHRICGITDPFCVHANGAKYPDQSPVKTLAFSRRSRVVVTTDAAGFANILVTPQFGFNPSTPASISVGNAVTQWAAMLPITSLTGITNYRIVSAGFVVRHIVAPLTSAGMVHLRMYGSENGALIGTVDTTTYNATAALSVPVQEASEIACVLPRTSQMPQTFYPMSSDTGVVTNTQTHGFCYSTVAVSGGPFSTPVLEIEFFTNIEMIFEEGSELAQVCTPPPPSNGGIAAVAGHVTSALTPMVKEGVATFGRMIVAKATRAAVTYVAGPAAGAAAGAALAINVD